MKRLLPALLIVLLLGVAGAGWFVWLRPHDRLALARSLMAKGDARDAQLELRGTVMQDPANAEAHFRLGEVQLRLGDPIAAEAELTKARERGWDPKAIVAPMAEAVLAQGRNAEVLASFSPDGLPPEKAATVLVARSEAALALHQPQQAADAATQAERLAPGNAGAALASAEVAAARRDSAATNAAIGRALAIEPHNVTALLMQAQTRAEAGDGAGELASLNAAVEAAPTSLPARYARAELLLQQGRDADARADVAAMLKQVPRSPRVNYLSAQLLLRGRDYAGADAALTAIGPSLDQLPRGEMLRAIVKANLKQPEQAAEAASRYLARAPDDPAAYQLVAGLALQAHRPADAVETLTQAANANHATSTIWQQLALAQSQLGNTDAALAAMQQAAVLAPKDPTILTGLAALQLGRGNPTAAAGDLQHLLDMQPDGPAPAATPAAIPVAASSDAGSSGAPPATGNAPPAPSQTAIALILTSLQAGQLDRAQAGLDRLRRLGGATPVQLDTLTGLVKAAQFDSAGAEQAFRDALARPGLTPREVAATRVNLAGVLSMAGKRDEAESELRQVLSGDPANLAALAALQRQLLTAGRTSDAVTVLEAGHAAAPGNPSLVVALADLYDRTGQAPHAVQLLDAQLKAAPPTAQDAPQSAAAQEIFVLKAARARAQLSAGQRAEGVATLRDLLAARPRDIGLRGELVRLLLADHDFTGAQALIDEGLAAQPGSPALLPMSVAIALQSGGMQAGLDRADMLMRDPVNLPAARLLRGDVYMAVKKYPEAAAAYAAELKADDAPSTLTLAAASAERAAGRPDQAVGLLRDYLGTHPDAADVASMLAVSEIGAKHLESARTALEQVLAKQPNDAAALNNLAWVDEQLHQPQEAQAMAQRSWLLSATPQAADTLGWIMLGGGSSAPEPGRAGAALGLLRQAATGLPSDPSVQYHYAAALKANGQGPAAAGLLQKLVSGPVFDEQPQARAMLAALPHS